MGFGAYISYSVFISKLALSQPTEAKMSQSPGKRYALKAWFYKMFGRNYTATICGHKTKLFSQTEIFGEKLFIQQKPGMDYCPACMAKMSIRCAWCGRAIKIGDPVTLYTPAGKNFKIPEHAVVYREDPLQLVGCLRWECAEMGADRCGFWIPPGKVHRVMSLLEQVLSTGDVAICNDITDPSQAIPIED